MRFVDEFRDGEVAAVVARQIAELVDPDRHYKVMEVCGGHTHSIYRYGVHDYLPENVELCTVPAARCASSRWAGWTTASPSPSSRASPSPASAT